MTWVHPEVGRKLLAHDLMVDTVVILRRGSKAATFWVRTLGGQFVGFYAGANPDKKYHLFLETQNDGTLRDDTGREVEVYEYLGKL